MQRPSEAPSTPSTQPGGRPIDYDEHNAEVQTVWEAYRKGAPQRVPMMLGISARYTTLGHPANPRGITFEQYFTDPDLMLTRQLEHRSWVRHHVPQDAEMGLPETGWDINVDFQNSFEAGWFGCPIRYFDGDTPDTQPLLQDEDRKRALFDQGIPDPFSGGLMRRNWEFYDYFRRKQDEGFTWQGRPISAVSPAGLGSDGPLTVACNLRGASQVYMDLAADPDYARELLGFITEASIVRIQAYRRRLGMPLKTTGLRLPDDAIQSISSATYRDLVMPFHRRLIEALSTGGPYTMHLCGDASRHFPLLRDELGVSSFDTGFPIDFGEVRQQVGPGVEISGGPSVMFLQSATPAAVLEEVKRILASGIVEGGRFILREGNNMSPGIALENLWAMYDAVRAFGRYPSRAAGL